MDILLLYLQGNILYLMFYTFASTLSLVVGGYLLWRRNNSVAPAITPPLRLRRWAAAFLVSLTLSHIWYLPLLYIRSADTRLMWYYLAGALDLLVVYPLAIGVLLAMLQDRRRPLWPVYAMLVPLFVGLAWTGLTLNEELLPLLFAYYPVVCFGLFVYMAGSVRQYGRWLRDNYADLEHKEVWQSFVAMAIMLLALSIYAWETKIPSVKYVTQLFNVIISLFLLWRVETLSDLGTDHEKDLATAATAADVPDTGRPSAAADVEGNSLSPLLSDNIAKLLRYHCEEKRLYLQHDLTLQQLAKAVGTNRCYLSQYFSQKGLTYNAYINNLRLARFEAQFRRAMLEHRPVTAQQLAKESGFRSYSTFSTAFKQRMGQTVSGWMRSLTESDGVRKSDETVENAKEKEYFSQTIKYKKLNKQ